MKVCSKKIILKKILLKKIDILDQKFKQLKLAKSQAYNYLHYHLKKKNLTIK